MLSQSWINSPYPHVIPQYSFLLRSLFKVNFLHRKVPTASSLHEVFSKVYWMLGSPFSSSCSVKTLLSFYAFTSVKGISNKCLAKVKWAPANPLTPPPYPFATILKYIYTKGELLLTSSDIKTERVFLSVNPSYKQSERSFNGCQNAKASKRWRKHYTRSFTVHSLAVVMNAN